MARIYRKEVENPKYKIIHTVGDFDYVDFYGETEKEDFNYDVNLHKIKHHKFEVFELVDGEWKLL